MATVTHFETSLTEAVADVGGDHGAAEATRYLAAAAYLDRKFRNRALSAVKGEPYRALGPTTAATSESCCTTACAPGKLSASEMPA